MYMCGECVGIVGVYMCGGYIGILGVYMCEVSRDCGCTCVECLGIIVSAYMCGV